MEHKLNKRLVKHRAVAVDTYSGVYTPINGIFDSREAAQSALKEYFQTHKHQGTAYDIGGYVEKVELDLAYDPTNDEFHDDDNQT